MKNNGRKLAVYTNTKEGKTYFFDIDTAEFYVASLGFNSSAKNAPYIGVFVAMVLLPILGSLVQPIRPFFEVNISKNLVDFIVVGSIFLQVVLGVFSEKIIKFLISRSKVNGDSGDEKNDNAVMFEPIELDKKEIRKFIRKSILETIFILGFIVFAWFFIVQRFLNDFIASQNLLSYFAFFTLSTLFISISIVVTSATIQLYIHIRKKLLI